MESTFLATLGQVLVRLLDMHGLDGRALLREAGVEPVLLRKPDARVPGGVADVLLSKAAAAIPDAAFGLRAVRCWHPSNLGALGHAWLASSTLRTGLLRLERYGRLLVGRSPIRIVDGREGLRLVYSDRRRDPVLRAIGTDLALSLIVDMCRMNYGAWLRPVEVRLARQPPASVDPYRGYFGCPVHFNAPDDSFLLSPRIVGELLPSGNRKLAGLLDGVLISELAALDRRDIPARCRAALLDHLASGAMSEQAMARELHMSRRSLQRKLAEAGTTYQRLADDTRRDLALRYMEEGARTATDVTFLLGFSDLSAFTRAFRRWTGVSPTRYRARGSC